MFGFRGRVVPLLAMTVVTFTFGLGLALAQDDAAKKDEPKKDAPKPAANAKDKSKAKAKDKNAAKKAPGVAGGAPPKKGRPNAADPLAKADAAKAAPAAAAKADAALPKAKAADPNNLVWPYWFRLKLSGADGTPLSASYYPPRNRFNAPIVVLLHDRGSGRSAKDWQEPLDELKGIGLAESLQEEGYAVLVPDLRGHGANQRKELSDPEWRALPADLQAFYLFLVDRHNRGDFNLGKLGVVAVGESANLVTAWANLPGAAVSSDGRVSDLSALVLISPIADSGGLKLVSTIPPLAPRVPMLVVCGERDQASHPVVKELKPIIERQQRSKVTFHDTPLHGYRLIHFYPKVAASIGKSLEDPIKGRVLDWEPRFLLTPMEYALQGVYETRTVAKAEAETKKAAAAPKKAGDPARKDEAAKKDDADAKKKD